MHSRVVISGIGILSALGIGLEEHLISLKQEKYEFERPTDDSFTSMVMTVPEFKVEKYVENKKSIRFFSKQTKLGCSAAEMARIDAGVSKEEIKSRSFDNALIIGVGHSENLMSMSDAIVSCVDDNGNIDYEKLGDEGYRMLTPLWILGRLPNTTAGQISIQNMIQGLNYSLVSGINSGIVSLGEAFMAIREQRAIRVVCGGIEDEIFPEFLYSLWNKALISDTSNYAKPFSNESKGFAAGEGAAVFIVEKEEEVLKRGGKIYAEIIGYSNHYIPNLKKLDNMEDIAKHLEKSMLKAINMAGVSADDVDFVQASAGGLRNLDCAEAISINNIFSHKPYTTSAQPYVGNTFAASGAISTAFACLQLQESFIAPILYTEKLFLDNELKYVKNQYVENDNRICLVNSFSHLGEICSLVLKKR